MTLQTRRVREQRPRNCPHCGSERVAKEKIMGNDTGDWICGSCKETWQIRYIDESYDDGK